MTIIQAWFDLLQTSKSREIRHSLADVTRRATIRFITESEFHLTIVSLRVLFYLLVCS